MPARRRRLAAAVAGCLLAAACSSGDDGGPTGHTGAAPPAGCHTDVLARWNSDGLAVIWIGRTDKPAAVAAMDVHTGRIRSYCEIPGVVDLRPGTLPMRQGGTDYPGYRTDVDLMLATQWFSSDFRWFAAPGAPLVDVAAGRRVTLDVDGTVVGVGPDLALVRTGDGTGGTGGTGGSAGWCTVPLPPTDGAGCAPLRPPGGAGGFVVGEDGKPVWVPADAVPLRFGQVTAYALTDGHRVYRVDTEPAAQRRAGGPQGELGNSVDVAPTGLGGFQSFMDEQPVHDLAGWFAVDGVDPGEVRTSRHATTARDPDFTWLLGRDGDVSRTVADGGTVAVGAAVRQVERDGRPVLETHFGALVDGTDRVVDLTEERGLRCPVTGTLCRIVDWPDHSLDDASSSG